MDEHRARVAIIVQSKGVKYQVILPTDVSSAQVLPSLTKQLALPTEGPDAGVLRYSLALRDDEGHVRLLEGNETLARAGVQDGSVLIIMAPPLAGPHLPPSGPITGEWEYLDFDLQIIRAGGGYQAQVLGSPAGQASEVFEPLDWSVVDAFIHRAAHMSGGLRRVGSRQWKAAKAFGRGLSNRLFRGQILACLMASMQEARNRKCGLRLKLRLDEAPELMNVPWEFLYCPQRHNFLASFEDTPIVRFLGVTGSIPPMPVELPLCILAMAASPDNLRPLDVRKEQYKLEEALQSLIDGGLVVIDWVEGGSLTALHQHLMHSDKQYHVFHFAGHGDFDENDCVGFLAMSGARGGYVEVSGERLGPILSTGHQEFRLAVLNACEGARIDRFDPFSAVATSLIPACRLPAAIAMQFGITDEAAITFASSFYAALATGRPVDTAVTAGRQAIWALQSDVEWGTPVLYMRSSDGQLFKFD
jgi:hypothetical protein